MTEVQYGFVNADNLLTEIAYFIDGDTPTIERVKKEYGASAYYKIDETRPPAVIKRSIWTGSYFTPGCLYSTWQWDNTLEDWVAPKPYPTDEKVYLWSDEAVNWVEVTE